MGKTIRIAHNAVTAKLVEDDKEAKAICHRLLSFLVEGKEFMSAFSGGTWNGRSSLFSMVKRSFPAGFVPSIQQKLAAEGYGVSLVRHGLPLPLGPENPIVDEFGNDDPRYDYQMDLVHRLLRHGRGIAQVATGGGKTKIALLCTVRIGRPTLFVTTRSVLMYQMRDAYLGAGIACGIIGDGEWNPIAGGVNVAMVQTLVARLRETTPELEAEQEATRRSEAEEKAVQTLKAKLIKAKVLKKEIPGEIARLRREQEEKRGSVESEAKEYIARAERQNALAKETRALLKTFEFVIGEEAHEAGSNSYTAIMDACINAPYRLALTGTPFMRDDAEGNMRLMGCFGQIIIRVSEKLLIDRGILAEPFFRYLDLPAPEKLFKSTGYERATKLGIVENRIRNTAIVRETMRAVKHGLPVMILVTRKRHGEILAKALGSVGIKASFIKGDNDNPERRRELKKLAAGSIDVLIGTTILDVGVDVPAVGMVILAGGGKAEVALRQRIGRGLRAKKTGPNVCFVLDFVDRGNGHLASHAKMRQAIVAGTDGFAQRILPANDNFPWHLFRKNAA